MFSFNISRLTIGNGVIAFQYFSSYLIAIVSVFKILVGITIYVRYRQVLQLFEHHSDLGNNLLRYNRLAVWYGLVSCLGISIVGNFQETNVRIVHLVGAFCCFGFGTLYFWMQALISYMIYPIAGTKRHAHLRLAMAVCCTVLFIVLAVTGVMSHIMFKGLNPRKWYVIVKISKSLTMIFINIPYPFLGTPLMVAGISMLLAPSPNGLFPPYSRFIF